MIITFLRDGLTTTEIVTGIAAERGRLHLEHIDNIAYLSGTQYLTLTVRELKNETTFFGKVENKTLYVTQDIEEGVWHECTVEFNRESRVNEITKELRKLLGGY